MCDIDHSTFCKDGQMQNMLFGSSKIILEFMSAPKWTETCVPFRVSLKISDF